MKGSQLKMENDGTFKVALKGPNVKRAIERTKRLRDQGSLKSLKQTVLPPHLSLGFTTASHSSPRWSLHKLLLSHSFPKEVLTRTHREGSLNTYWGMRTHPQLKASS